MIKRVFFSPGSTMVIYFPGALFVLFMQRFFFRTSILAEAGISALTGNLFQHYCMTVTALALSSSQFTIYFNRFFFLDLVISDLNPFIVITKNTESLASERPERQTSHDANRKRHRSPLKR